MDKELVAEWLRYANMDLDLAKYVFATMHPAPLEIICYHCQQAAEKFLKATVIAFDEEVEKTHDLSKLLNVLEKFVDISVDMRQLAVLLTQFATKTRYPDTVSVDEDTTKLAISQAEKVKIWAEKIIADKSKDDTSDISTD